MISKIKKSFRYFGTKTFMLILLIYCIILGIGIPACIIKYLF